MGGKGLDSTAAFGQKRKEKDSEKFRFAKGKPLNIGKK